MLNSDNSLFVLLKPRVPAAEGNGGLRYADVGADPNAIIIVEAYLDLNSARVNDTYRLYWDDEYVTFQTLNNEHLQQGVVTFAIPANHIYRTGSGTHTLYYIATTAGGNEEPSPSENVLVKLDIPGGPDPDAGTEYINENLDPPEGIPDVIDDSVQSVRVSVPQYLNMAEGDKMVLDWGGQRLFYPPLQPNEVGSPVEFTVNRAMLEGASGKVIVRYEIRDIVNNWSKWSRSRETDVDVGIIRPVAPWVAEAEDDGALDFAVLGGGDATAQVFDPQHISLNDQINLTWSGFPPDGPVLPDFTLSKQATTVSRPLNFPIPNAQVKAIIQGYASLWYEIVKSGSPNLTSRRGRVDVTGQLELPRPTIENIKGDPSGDEIPPDAETRETTVRLRGKAAPDQKVEIFDGNDSWGQENVASDGFWNHVKSGLTAKTYRLTAKGLYEGNPDSPVRSFTVAASGVSGDESFERQAPGMLALNTPLPFANNLFITVTAAAQGTTIVVPGIAEFGNRALQCAPQNKLRFTFGGEIKRLQLSHANAGSTTNKIEFFNGNTTVHVFFLERPVSGSIAYENFNLTGASTHCELTVDSFGVMLDNLIWRAT